MPKIAQNITKSKNLTKRIFDHWASQSGYSDEKGQKQRRRQTHWIDFAMCLK